MESSKCPLYMHWGTKKVAWPLLLWYLLCWDGPEPSLKPVVFPRHAWITLSDVWTLPSSLPLRKRLWSTTFSEILYWGFHTQLQTAFFSVSVFLTFRAGTCFLYSWRLLQWTMWPLPCQVVGRLPCFFDVFPFLPSTLTLGFILRILHSWWAKHNV